MFSGGLDSILAASIMHREGIDVIAVHFYNGFNTPVTHELASGAKAPWTPPESVVKSAGMIGVRLLPVDVSGSFRDILLHPRHGYGSEANPCIDCRVFLLRHAKDIMEREGASFVFTGEVVGQRPMSQMKLMLRHVEKASGLEGMLLRPLSALILEPTIPEKEGLVDRSRLYGFSGRSRHPQQALAREFGIDFYPAPAGGCHLTDVSFGARFRDLIEHLPGREPSAMELASLKTGRHIRLTGGIKLVIGRNEAENLFFTGLFHGAGWRFHPTDIPGADVFAPEETPDTVFTRIAAIAARYSKGRDADTVVIAAENGNEIRLFDVKPATQSEIDHLLVY
jgi:tRNA-uridine 2-sulfurtransferase